MSRIVRRSLSGSTVAISARLKKLRAEEGIRVEYPRAALQEAQQMVVEHSLPSRDCTSVPFITVDPVGSQDLDQALHLQKIGSGYRVRYAIADLPSFVPLGGTVDATTWQRAVTLYFPDCRIGLHPEVISENAASLLPGKVRSAFVWDMRLDAEGALITTDVYRARVRSQARFSYEQVSPETDARFALLQEIGQARIRQESARGGASLPRPSQEVEHSAQGYKLVYRPMRESEHWNAQISLLTGMAAAKIMLQARIGILRTMPAAEHHEVQALRMQAQAVGVIWPEETSYGEFLRSLTGSNPTHLALIHQASRLFRGARYTAFAGEVPGDINQAAIAAPYAHVTAPIRRLVDRYGLLLCAAINEGAEIPLGVREALPKLDAAMTAGRRRAGKMDRAVHDLLEAAVLSSHIGDVVPAVVVGHTSRGARLVLPDLAVEHVVKSAEKLVLGEQIMVRIVHADMATGEVELSLA